MESVKIERCSDYSSDTPQGESWQENESEKPRFPIIHPTRLWPNWRNELRRALEQKAVWAPQAAPRSRPGIARGRSGAVEA